MLLRKVFELECYAHDIKFNYIGICILNKGGHVILTEILNQDDLLTHRDYSTQGFMRHHYIYRMLPHAPYQIIFSF